MADSRADASATPSATDARPRHAAQISRLTPYRRGLLGLALVTLLWRGWTASRFTWEGDDWVYMADARSMGFVHYLFQDYRGHLMPGEFLVTWVVTRVAPLEFWLPTALVATASAAAVLLWGRALAELAGERLVLLAPLSVLTLSPLALRSTAWWASALQVIPLQISMALVVLTACRAGRTRGRRDIAWLVLALVTGLFFWQKAVLLVIPAVGVLLHVRTGALVTRARQVAAPAAALAVTSTAYLVVYLTLTRTAPGEREFGVRLDAVRSPESVAGFFARGFGDLLAPGLLGGPWGTLPLRDQNYIEPPRVVAIAAVAVVLCVALFVLARLRGAWLPLTMVVAYVVVSWGLLLYSGRFDDMQTFAINHERYHVDGIAIAMLGAAMLIDSASRGRVKQSTPRARRTTALVCVALAVSLVVGNIAAAVRVGTHPGKSWVDNLTADLERRGTVTVLDANPPVRVMPPVWWGTDARLARMLSPLTEVTFGRPAAELSMVDDDGHLRQVVVGDASHALPGPVEGCGYALGAGQTATARMTEELYSWEWVVQVDTVAGEGGTLTVGMADASATFDVAKGVTRHQFALTGPVPSTVTLSVAKDSPTLCVSQVIAGPAGPQE